MHVKMSLILLAIILSLGVVGQDAVTVDAAGNLGLGTPSPAAPLHVVGNSGREVARFQGSTDASNNRNFLSLYSTNPASWWEMSIQDSAGNGTQNGLGFRERSGTGDSLVRLYLASGGNVGIGTTNPQFNLDLGSGSLRTGTFYVNGSAGSTPFCMSPSGQFEIDAPGIHGGRFVVKENGNVGIGTATPTQQLEVSSTSSTHASIAITAKGTGSAYLYFDAADGDLAGADYFCLFQDNNLNMHIYSGDHAGNLLMMEATPGKVAIGTASPDGDIRLTVNGGIRTYGHSYTTGHSYVSGMVYAYEDVYARGVKLSSDRELKAEIALVDPQSICDRLEKLPISTWHFKSDKEKNKRMGPMAQDVQEVLGIGSDGKTVNLGDLNAVSLLASQALIKENKSLKKEVTAVKTEMVDLRKRADDQAKVIQDLKAMVAQLSERMAK